MTLNGTAKFKTIFGGLVSVAVFGFIFAMLVYKLMLMVNKSQSTITKDTLSRPITGASTIFAIGEKNMSISFALTDYWASVDMYNKSFGTFMLTENRIQQLKNETTGVGYTV